jgi:putative membrane protein
MRFKVFNDLFSQLQQMNRHKVRSFTISFYLIGFIGILLPISHPLFIRLTPFALLLSLFIVLAYHNFKIASQSIVVFVLIFMLGFGIELIGVKTGKIFGNYWYGGSLGPKIFETPVIIGINWLLLVYLSANIVDRYIKNKPLAVFLASLTMVAYDFVLEQVAPKIDMWYWQNNTIPIQNYLAWFFISLIFQSVFKLSKIPTENKLAALIFGCQSVLFIGLFIFYSI